MDLSESNTMLAEADRQTITCALRNGPDQAEPDDIEESISQDHRSGRCGDLIHHEDDKQEQEQDQMDMQQAAYKMPMYMKDDHTNDHTKDTDSIDSSITDSQIHREKPQVHSWSAAHSDAEDKDESVGFTELNRRDANTCHSEQSHDLKGSKATTLILPEQTDPTRADAPTFGYRRESVKDMDSSKTHIHSSRTLPEVQPTASTSIVKGGLMHSDTPRENHHLSHISYSLKGHQHSSKTTQTVYNVSDLPHLAQTPQNVGIEFRTDDRVSPVEHATRISTKRRFHSSADNPGPNIVGDTWPVPYGGFFGDTHAASPERRQHVVPETHISEEGLESLLISGGILAEDADGVFTRQSLWSFPNANGPCQQPRSMAPVPSGPRPVNTLRNSQPHGRPSKPVDLVGIHDVVNDERPAKRQRRPLVDPVPHKSDRKGPNAQGIPDLRRATTDFATRLSGARDLLPSSSSLGEDQVLRSGIGKTITRSTARRLRRGRNKEGGVQGSISSGWSERDQGGRRDSIDCSTLDNVSSPICDDDDDDEIQHDERHAQSKSSMHDQLQNTALNKISPQENYGNEIVSVELPTSHKKLDRLEKNLLVSGENHDRLAGDTNRSSKFMEEFSKYFLKPASQLKRNRSTMINRATGESGSKIADEVPTEEEDDIDELASETPPLKRSRRELQNPRDHGTKLVEQVEDQDDDTARPDLSTRGNIKPSTFGNNLPSPKYSRDRLRLTACFSENQYYLHPRSEMHHTLLYRHSDNIWVVSSDAGVNPESMIDMNPTQIKKIRHFKAHCQIFQPKDGAGNSKIHLTFHLITDAEKFVHKTQQINKGVIIKEDASVPQIFNVTRDRLDRTLKRQRRLESGAGASSQSLQSMSDMQSTPVSHGQRAFALMDDRQRSRSGGEELRTEAKQDGPYSATKKTRLVERMRSLGDQAGQPSRTMRIEPKSFYATGEPRRVSARKQGLEPATKRPSPSLELTWTDLNPRWKEKWQESVSYSWQSGGKKGNTPVDWNDIERLDEGAFLNDNLVEFYVRYLQSQAEEQDPTIATRVYIHNSFFYPKLTSRPFSHENKISYKSIERWTSKVNLASYDYIVVPVNENLHWYLAIICNAPKLLKPLIEKTDLKIPVETMTETSRLEEELPAQGARILQVTQPMESMSLNEAEPDVEPSEANERDARIIVETVPHTEHDGLPAESAQVGPLNLSPAIVMSDPVDSSPKSVASKKGSRKSQPPVRMFDEGSFRIITLDSLGMKHSPTCTNLKLYMDIEIRTKLGLSPEFPRIVGGTAINLPQQDNHCDCGVFLLDYVQQFLRAPELFMRHVMNPQSEEKLDWQNPSAIRERIREVLFKLQAHQIQLKQYEKMAKKAKRKERARDAPSPPTKNDKSLHSIKQASSSILHSMKEAEADEPKVSTRSAKLSTVANNQERLSESLAPLSIAPETSHDIVSERSGPDGIRTLFNKTKRLDTGDHRALDISNAMSDGISNKELTNAHHVHSGNCLIEVPESFSDKSQPLTEFEEQRSQGKSRATVLETVMNERRHIASLSSIQNQSNSQFASKRRRPRSPLDQDTPGHWVGKKQSFESPKQGTTNTSRKLESPDRETPPAPPRVSSAVVESDVMLLNSSPHSHSRQNSSSSTNTEGAQQQLLGDVAQQEIPMVADEVLTDQKAGGTLIDDVINKYEPKEPETVELKDDPRDNRITKSLFPDNKLLSSPDTSTPSHQFPLDKQRYTRRITSGRGASGDRSALVEHRMKPADYLDAGDANYLSKLPGKISPARTRSSMGSHEYADAVEPLSPDRKRKQAVPKMSMQERNVEIICLD